MIIYQVPKVFLLILMLYLKTYYTLSCVRLLIAINFPSLIQFPCYGKCLRILNSNSHRNDQDVFLFYYLIDAVRIIH